MGHRPASPVTTTRKHRRLARGLVPAALVMTAAALAGCGPAGGGSSRGGGIRVDTGRPASGSQPAPSVTISSIPVSATSRPTLPPPAAPTTVAVAPVTTTTTPPTTAAPTPTTTAPRTTPPTTAAATTTTTAPATTTTIRPSGPAPRCQGSQLSANQVPLAEGTGHYFLAWSLTDTSGSACQVPAGRPALELDNAAGQAVVHYRTAPLRGEKAATVTLAPHHAAWFLTEEVSTACLASTGVSGGPFAYEISLPGGAGTVSWRPSYLDAASIPNLCTRVGLEIGPVQASQPRA